MEQRSLASAWLRPGAIGAVLVLAVLAPARPLAADDPPLKGAAAELYRKAQGGRHHAQAEKLHPSIEATSDGRSFLVIWKSSKRPRRWIVSLHGSRGFATDDLAIWHPHLEGREVGLVCVQWWLGEGDTTSAYFTPAQIHREVDFALQKLGVEPGTAMLHGFSRGSANSYAVAALDAGRGKRYFSLCVASSGGVGLDYPPTRGITGGEYGDHPLEGTLWVTAAGGRDENPDRDGIPAMRRTAAWLKEQGATVIDAIEDPNEGHGALMRNRDNARRLLDRFLEQGR